MKRSEIISAHREAIAAYMVEHYRIVLECGGKVQYKLYIWEDGELEGLEGPQGDNSWLKARDMEPRELFYVCTIDAPYFTPWDLVDHAAPEDEAEREAEEKEIIDWCMSEYKDNLTDVLYTIIAEAEQEEEYDL